MTINFAIGLFWVGLALWNCYRDDDVGFYGAGILAMLALEGTPSC